MHKVGYFREELNSNDIIVYLVGVVNGKTIFAALTDDTIYEFASNIDVNDIVVSDISDYYKHGIKDNTLYLTLKDKVLCGQPEELEIDMDSYEFTDLEETPSLRSDLYGNYHDYLSLRN